MELEQYVAERRLALFRFAVVLTGDSVLADEIVSDVIGKAFEQWTRVNTADNVHAYVRRMVLNEFLARRRRSARVVVSDDVGGLVQPVADPAEAHADHLQLVEELRLLPPKQRAAIVLRFYEGMTYLEIADLLGSGENAVRSNVFRALATLRIRLTDPLHESHSAHSPTTAEAHS